MTKIYKYVRDLCRNKDCVGLCQQTVTSKQKGDEIVIKATISSIEGNGVGRYAVTYPKPGENHEGEAITFSFNLWRGDSEPFIGQGVVLSDLENTPKGLRANMARPNK